jgi:hypothetical protein
MFKDVIHSKLSQTYGVPISTRLGIFSWLLKPSPSTVH